MMAHSNISVFIPHEGCPNTCSFCNQRTISRSIGAPTAAQADTLIADAYRLMNNAQQRKNAEIAFFGGSFTAIDREYMCSLLETANKYLISGGDKNGFGGIRISTRPDCIDGEILMLLKKYGVTAIELGAQSMSDSVLYANDRGHTAEDVKRACRLIGEYGFETGLQMMVGLYKSTVSDELFTMREIAALRPSTVRIYPVAVLKGTRLAELYESGEYRLFSFDTCVRLCADMLSAFSGQGIRVIRLGLHAEDGVGKDSIAGFYHPAFGEIVRSELARRRIEEELTGCGKARCGACGSMMSILVGHKRSNRLYFAGKNVTFECIDSVPPKTIAVNGRIYPIN